MFQLSTKPQSIGKVLDEGVRLFFASFKQVLILSILASVAVMLPNFFVNEAVTRIEAGDAANGQQIMVQFVGLLIVGMILFMIFYAAMYDRIGKTSQGRESSLSDSLRVGFRKLIPNIVAIILYALAVVGGTLLLLIPGIILMLSLIFSMALIVCDDHGPVRALKTSHSLVWGNWWRTMTVFLVPAVIAIILVIVLLTIVGVVSGISISEGDKAALDAGANQAINIATTLYYIIIYPLMSSIILIQLNDLKLRKQGSDLEARVAAA